MSTRRAAVWHVSRIKVCAKIPRPRTGNRLLTKIAGLRRREAGGRSRNLPECEKNRLSGARSHIVFSRRPSFAITTMPTSAAESHFSCRAILSRWRSLEEGEQEGTTITQRGNKSSHKRDHAFLHDGTFREYHGNGNKKFINYSRRSLAKNRPLSLSCTRMISSKTTEATFRRSLSVTFEAREIINRGSARDNVRCSLECRLYGIVWNDMDGK